MESFTHNIRESLPFLTFSDTEAIILRFTLDKALTSFKGITLSRSTETPKALNSTVPFEVIIRLRLLSLISVKLLLTSLSLKITHILFSCMI